LESGGLKFLMGVTGADAIAFWGRKAIVDTDAAAVRTARVIGLKDLRRGLGDDTSSSADGGEAWRAVAVGGV